MASRPGVRPGPTYVLVNPFPRHRANGVTSYLRNLRLFLRRSGIPVVCISNDRDLPRREYQRHVRDALLPRLRTGRVVVEAPELKAPTLLLPPDAAVHVRLHCPNALVEAGNGWPVQWGEFAEEMEVARTARVVSSPSHALLRALDGHLAARAVHVYKNPPPPGVLPQLRPGARGRDVAFLGRFMRSKGVDSLVPVLERLPAGQSVALAGRDADRFAVPSPVRCQVALHGEIAGRARWRFLGEARVSLVLGRFENCSMTILESLAVGTVVVGWRVGGNGEIASPRLVRLVALDDCDALVATVLQALREPHPDPEEFREAVARVGADFRAGWRRVWSGLRGGRPVPVYRGMGCGGRRDREAAASGRERGGRAPSGGGPPAALCTAADGPP
ncbi:MAG TPA: glycosyltransferase [Methylomirabilota bacterium]|nr:glycosyltransferase [Methylomirabilota bacterium]